MSSSYDWLKSQLPDKLAWGDSAVTLSIKNAPPNVKAAVLQLLRVHPENTDTVMARASMAIVNSREKGDSLSAIPAKPTKHFLVGTYRIKWTINYSDGTKIGNGSKVYRGLEKEPVVEAPKPKGIK